MAQGKTKNFNEDQEREIARALSNFRNSRDLTDEALAKEMSKAIGQPVSQQTANNVRHQKGISYVTATAATRVLGYKGVDEFFEMQGVALGQRKKGELRGKNAHEDNQVLARRLAAAAGISEEAILRYDKRMKDRGITNQPVKRWVDGYSAEQDAITDERRASAGLDGDPKH